jgi:NADH:ubiquinone oxidoreductase subunit 6 (subunit J)
VIIYTLVIMLIMFVILFISSTTNIKKSVYLFVVNCIISMLAYSLGFTFYAAIFLILNLVTFIANWSFSISNYPTPYKVAKNIDVRYAPYLITLLCFILISIFVLLIHSNSAHLEATVLSITNISLVMKSFFINYPLIISSIPIFIFLSILLSLEIRRGRN